MFRAMRLSVEQSDLGFQRYEQSLIDGEAVTILLDGNIVTGVHTADDQEGIIVVPSFDERGNLVVKNDQIEMVTKRGAVTILLSPKTEN